MTRDELMKRIGQAIGSAKKLEPILHSLVVDCAKHAQETGDATPALHMYENMPKSQRRKAMAIWWKTFSCIMIKDGKDGISVKLNTKSQEWNIPEGEQHPFYELDEANVGRAMGEIDALSILNKKLESLDEKIQLWESLTEESEKVKVFKLNVNPIREREKLVADIGALTRARQAA